MLTAADELSAIKDENDIKPVSTAMSQMRIADQASIPHASSVHVAPPLSPAKTCIQHFITQPYDRELVTRFVNACPRVNKLSEKIGRSTSTLSQLKKPEKYGELAPSAKLLWGWLQKHGVLGLQTALDLSEKEIKHFKNQLDLLEFSTCNIIYDSLDDAIRPTEDSPLRVSDLVSYLKRMKGAFTKINLANNLLSDEGFAMLVAELKEHDSLEEIDLRENSISDIGLRQAQDLIKLPHLRCIYFSGNYGPSEETMKLLVDWAPKDQRKKLRKIIK